MRAPMRLWPEPPRCGRLGPSRCPRCPAWIFSVLFRAPNSATRAVLVCVYGTGKAEPVPQPWVPPRCGALSSSRTPLRARSPSAEETPGRIEGWGPELSAQEALRSCSPGHPACAPLATPKKAVHGLGWRLHVFQAPRSERLWEARPSGALGALPPLQTPFGSASVRW